MGAGKPQDTSRLESLWDPSRKKVNFLLARRHYAVPSPSTPAVIAPRSSNNWVIDGKHTASGKPLYSQTTCILGLNEPNIWYMADLRAPGFHAAGVMVPSACPSSSQGTMKARRVGIHRALRRRAGSLHPQPDGKGNFQVPDGNWKPVNVDHETIHVRGRKDLIYDVRLTDHGPLLDPIFTRDFRSIALKWTLYDTTLNSIPLYAINTTSNWTEFTPSARAMVLAHAERCLLRRSGDTSDYHAVGRIPLRPSGIADKPVHDAAHEWQKLHPFRRNAQRLRSALRLSCHRQLAAVTSEKSKYPITNNWADPYRAERIYKLLQGRDQLKLCRYARNPNRHLQRNGSGAWSSTFLRHRSHH